MSISCNNDVPMDHPPLRLMILRDNILTFKQLEGEKVECIRKEVIGEQNVRSATRRRAGQWTSRRIAEQVDAPDLIRRLDHHINWRSCKSRRAKYPLGVSPSGSAKRINVAENARTGRFLKGQRFQISNPFTFPHFLTSKKHTRTIFPVFLRYYRFLVVDLVFGVGNLCRVAF
uniref:Uncharacterized protein n=1 Tax=Solanum tuberosum TaxID=4113 RepID=M1DEN5_SOLTU